MREGIKHLYLGIAAMVSRFHRIPVAKLRNSARVFGVGRPNKGYLASLRAGASDLR
jgi:hypothetical protein